MRKITKIKILSIFVMFLLVIANIAQARIYNPGGDLSNYVGDVSVTGDFDLTGDLTVTGSIIISDIASSTTFRASDGSVGTPSYSFIDDTDTGIFRNGDDILAVSLGGNTRASFSTTYMRGGVNAYSIQTSEAISGTAPIYTFRTDENTGINRAGADQLSLIASSTEGLRIDGTNTGGGSIQVLLADGTATYPSLSFIDDTDTGFYRESADSVRFVSGGVDTWAIDGTRLGSFLSSRPQLLDEATTATNPVYVMAGDPDTGIGKAANDQLSLIASGTELLRLVGPGASTDGRVQLPNDTFLAGLDAGGSTFTNMFKLTASSTIEVGAELTNLGSFKFEENSGLQTHTYQNVSSASADGTIHGSAFIIDGKNVFQYSALSDGAGGVDTLQFTLDPEGDFGAAANPTLSFGDKDTGFYESSDDILKISTGGADRFSIGGNTFTGVAVGSFSLGNVNSSDTVPSISPDYSDTDTGIGAKGADQLSIVSGGYEVMRASSTAATSTVSIGSNGITNGGCLKIADNDGAGYTYCQTLNGTLSCGTSSCE